MKENYFYPLESDWTTEEIIDVINLYTIVEKAYEKGVSKDEFINAYRKFKTIVPSKAQEKKLDKEFQDVSGYSIYQVKKASETMEKIKV